MRVGLPERGIDNADLIVTTRNALPTIIAALKDHERLEAELKDKHRHLENGVALVLAKNERIDELQFRLKAVEGEMDRLIADHRRMREAIRNTSTLYGCKFCGCDHGIHMQGCIKLELECQDAK